MNVRDTRRSRRWLYIGALVIVTGVVAGTTYGLLVWQREANKPIPVISSQTVRHTTDTPDETNQDLACQHYRVAAEKPRKIRISSIDVDTCVQPVGLDENKVIAAPNSIHLVGWYVDSPSPGEDGNSIMNGRVAGQTSNAVFIDLKYLQAGNEITIQYGDLSEKTFKVVETKQYDLAEVPEELSRRLDDADTQLTLVTHGEVPNSAAKTSGQRVIVRAVLSTQGRQEY
ncbi:TPA: hypothetical protein DCF80_03025 [Candidatus Saccharibacteria bacterium]|nr:hypothetical protein [Candidatus Saccharibacteria bacterium]HRK40513.1 class F sortase [Candidatus Saccharibacteria bacterium]